MPATHCAASADTVSLEFDGIVVAEIVRGEGEANDVFALNGDDAAAKAALFVQRQFERGRDVECVELAAGCVEEGFGFGEFFDGDTSRVERRSWLKRAGDRDAKADGVAGDVEAAACEREDMTVAVSRNAEAKARTTSWKNDDAFAPGDTAQHFYP